LKNTKEAGHILDDLTGVLAGKLPLCPWLPDFNRLIDEISAFNGCRDGPCTISDAISLRFAVHLHGVLSGQERRQFNPNQEAALAMKSALIQRFVG
jgi:hypothetical protein